MAGARISLTPVALTRAAFAPFGDVVETDGADSFGINDGMCTRFHDLAGVDVLAGAGRPLVNIFRAQPPALPLTIRMLERHPLSSQLFYPLQRQSFLVVVAPPGDAVESGSIVAFVTNGNQGVNYRPGVWHHPLIATGTEGDFMVVDRGGEGENCDEFVFDADGPEIVLVAL